MPRQDERADLTFCETFFGYPEEILADILRQENSLDIIIQKVGSDSPQSLIDEEMREVECLITTAEKMEKVPQDIIIMAYYTRIFTMNIQKARLSMKALDEYQSRRHALFSKKWD